MYFSLLFQIRWVCVYKLGQGGSFSSAVFNIMQLPYSGVQQWGKPDFYFQLQNTRQKGRDSQSLARTHGRISLALLLNPSSKQGFPSEPRSLWRLGKFPARFDEKQSFVWVIFTSRAQGTNQIIGLLWGCWDNWAAGFRVSWSVWEGLRLSLLMPLFLSPRSFWLFPLEGKWRGE